MNLEKGYFRLTFILSIIAGFVMIIIRNFNQFVGFKLNVLGFGVGFALIWIIYFFIYFVIIKFIIKGFKDK